MYCKSQPADCNMHGDWLRSSLRGLGTYVSMHCFLAPFPGVLQPIYFYTHILPQRLCTVKFENLCSFQKKAHVDWNWDLNRIYWPLVKPRSLNGLSFYHRTQKLNIVCTRRYLTWLFNTNNVMYSSWNFLVMCTIFRFHYFSILFILSLQWCSFNIPKE